MKKLKDISLAVLCRVVCEMRDDCVLTRDDLKSISDQLKISPALVGRLVAIGTRIDSKTFRQWDEGEINVAQILERIYQLGAQRS